ncbi:MAG: alpha/beta hydrolase [Alphaproteobacteria bacterium]|nr:alpha/beta hydrolase [Alphaproteobacteria bacterium]
MEPPATEFITANGMRFEVTTCGSGKKLALCLHGFPEHAYSWRHQLPLLAGMGYRVWAPNLRGYGNSTRPIGVAQYAMKHLLDDVAGLIDASGAREVVLIAHDWGGAIAWEFALRRIRPLSRLVVMNIPHPRLFELGVRRWAQLKRSWYILFFQLPWLPEWVLGRHGARAIGEAFRGMAIDKSRFPEEVLEVYQHNALQSGALTAMINYYRALFRKGARPEKARVPGKLDVPTLMIWGEADTALGKELTYGTENLVSDFTVHYLPGVSHWVQQEAPDKVNEILRAWLESTP